MLVNDERKRFHNLRVLLAPAKGVEGLRSHRWGTARMAWTGEKLNALLPGVGSVG